MATKVTPIQFLRSLVTNKRPDPTKLLAGQPAVNTAAAQPGLFFADDSGTSLFKVGPCTVGTVAPNDGATGASGSLGNTLGEMWLDNSISSANPVLKIWDGTQWLTAMPFTYGRPVISATAPVIGTYPDGTMWWNSTNGSMYIQYNDGTATQWIQVSSSTVS